MAKQLLAFIALLLSYAASAQVFTVNELTSELEERMRHGGSLPEGARVDAASLRYLQLSHWAAPDSVAVGELIVAADLADEVVEIFRELYDAGYLIEGMRLIDDYHADDEASMTDNNTSGFCYRPVAGSTKLSKHSLGRAIDINPLYNPYVKGTKVQPEAGRRYTDRTLDTPMLIAGHDDLAVRLFTAHGWSWGGDWKSLKDYQHFEK